METDHIIRTLKRRYNEFLPDFHKRRIIFWHDPEGDFAEMIDSVEIPGVKLLKLTGTNNFAAKKLLLHDDTTSDYLVYDPISYSNIMDNWLLDIEKQSESFRADLLSMRMEKMDLEETAPMRKAMKLYSKFFANAERTEKFESYGKCSDVRQLHLNVLAVLTSAESNKLSSVIRQVLIDDHETDENRSLDQIRRFGNEDVLWELIQGYTGFVRSENFELYHFAAHLMLTSQAQHLERLSDLEEYISPVHSANCNTVLQDWQRSSKSEILFEIIRSVEEKMHLEKYFSKLGRSELSELDVFSCADDCILKRYMSEISENIIKTEDIAQTVEKRRTMKWYDRVKNYYDGLMQIANMQRFYKDHAGGFHVGSHSELWKKYTEEYHLMDTYYRRFRTAFRNSMKYIDPELEDLFRASADHAENLYKNIYLRNLNSLWSNMIADELSVSPKLENIPHQEGFYDRCVRPLAEQGRVFVIISDALRYEVAAELCETLLRETKGNAEISSMQAMIPSSTKYGMAALLPHSRLEISSDLKVKCDGMPSDSTIAREKILQAKEKNSIAVTFKKLTEMSRAERQTYFKGVKIAYIYHNQIDAVGEKNVTEDEVFSACDAAMTEIKTIVRMITSELNGTNILITADHGFLYSSNSLEEWDKADHIGSTAESDRRYVISTLDEVPEYLVNVNLEKYGCEHNCYVPRECIRLKMQGGGVNYVHGGISLQELCVPVITYKNVKAGSKNYVEAVKAQLALLTTSRKISNSIFSLDFHQTERVGGKILPATYELSMRNAKGRTVSDIKTVIADNRNEDTTQRVFRVKFMLKSIEFKKSEPYYLVITEQGKNDVLLSIEFTIDIAFMNDFGF